jgi:hypothetical protein
VKSLYDTVKSELKLNAPFAILKCAPASCQAQGNPTVLHEPTTEEGMFTVWGMGWSDHSRETYFVTSIHSQGHFAPERVHPRPGLYYPEMCMGGTIEDTLVRTRTALRILHTIPRSDLTVNNLKKVCLWQMNEFEKARISGHRVLFDETPRRDREDA